MADGGDFLDCHGWGRRDLRAHLPDDRSRVKADLARIRCRNSVKVNACRELVEGVVFERPQFADVNFGAR